jgi:hypothetical protein
MGWTTKFTCIHCSVIISSIPILCQMGTGIGCKSAIAERKDSFQQKRDIPLMRLLKHWEITHAVTAKKTCRECLWHNVGGDSLVVYDAHRPLCGGGGCDANATPCSSVHDAGTTSSAVVKLCSIHSNGDHCSLAPRVTHEIRVVLIEGAGSCSVLQRILAIEGALQQHNNFLGLAWHAGHIEQ